MMREGLAGWERMGAVSFRAYYMSLLARAYLHDGAREQARMVLDAALALTEPRGDVWWVPELRRLHALLG